MAAKRVRLSAGGWALAVALALGGVLVAAVVLGLGGEEEPEPAGLELLPTSAPTATSTAGWWGEVESELISVLATPTLTATSAVTP